MGWIVGSELQRKDEREISFNVEVGTGSLLPGGKVALGFKRAWQKRGENYLESVATIAECSADEVIDVVAQGDGFTDVFGDGVNAIVQHSDAGYANTFARFVASALNDPAKVDVSAFLIERFAQFRPPHVRLFWRLCQSVMGAYSQTGKIDPETAIRIPAIFAAIAKDSDLPSMIVLTLIKDLIDGGVVVHDSNGIGITDLGSLAYLTVGPAGVSSILASGRITD